MPKKSNPTDSDLPITWTKEAEALTYEESLQALDLLMVKLQNDALPLAELQSSRTRYGRRIFCCSCWLMLEQESEKKRLI